MRFVALTGEAGRLSLSSRTRWNAPPTSDSVPGDNMTEQGSEESATTAERMRWRHVRTYRRVAAAIAAIGLVAMIYDRPQRGGRRRHRHRRRRATLLGDSRSDDDRRTSNRREPTRNAGPGDTKYIDGTADTEYIVGTGDTRHIVGPVTTEYIVGTGDTRHIVGPAHARDDTSGAVVSYSAQSTCRPGWPNRASTSGIRCVANLDVRSRPCRRLLTG